LRVSKPIISWLLEKSSLAVTKRSKIEKLKSYAQSAEELQFLKTLPPDQAPDILRYLGESKSQLRQDLFVLSENGFKRDGFFVEFGATDGVSLSNTYLLEKHFGWKGILAEPGKSWLAQLGRNRSSYIDNRCVWSDSTSTFSFNETTEAELSTIEQFSQKDKHKHRRKSKNIYPVQTISLVDLLTKFDAPKKIDYLSIDTEGSEYEILQSFDFGRYQFGVITCEHNFTENRQKIFQLLSKNGYIRKYQELSKFDDWYVRG
jgi:FkbM family methyltransferase